MFNTTQKSVDMLHGPLCKKIIWFAIPIALSSMLQQLFNAADTSVVGQFADSNALAAVGTNGEIVALLVTLSAGLSTGANVLIAKYIGERKTALISDAIHTAILFAILFGVCGAVLGQFIAEPLLILIKTPDSVLTAAVTYLRIYFIGYPFLMLYDFGSAILRAKGDSGRPFAALTISGVINVLLNLFFVIVCHLGVAGVAIATDISTAVSALLVCIWLFLERSDFHLSIKNLRIKRECLLPVLTIGIPSAIQGAVFCFANIFVQASVNSFGTIAAAGSTIAMNFEYFGYYMITAFGQAATTFTSQNFAAGLKRRCRTVLLICVVSAFIFSALITVPLTVFRTTFCGFFSPEDAVITAACVRIMRILLFEPICGFYEVPAGVLRGTGHSTLPAVLTVIGTCLLRIAWIFTVFSRTPSPEILFIIFPVSWVVTIILMWGGFFLKHPLRE